MKVYELLKGADVVDFNNCQDIEVSGVTGNSKRVKSGFAFVCISGTKFDGHDFGNALFLHGNAEQRIRLVHRRFSMRYHDKLRFFRKPFQIRCKSIHVRVVERRLDFVENTERHRTGF